MESEDQYQSGEYHSKHPDWHEGDSPWKAKQILKIIRKNNLSVKSVVDFGCGSGRVIAELAKHMSTGVQCFGYDISPQAIKIAKKFESDNCSFQVKDITKEFAEPVDLLLLVDVFEHIEDYIGFLKKVRTQAIYFAFHIPLELSMRALLVDYQISSRNSDGHLHFFTKATALRTLEDAGYKVMDCFYTKHWEVTRGFKSFLVTLPSRLLFHLAPDLVVKIFGGCSLMVLAKSG
ncbi:MAG: class I SAM-dependent methyltransferase [Nitrospinales bacterium]